MKDIQLHIKQPLVEFNYEILKRGLQEQLKTYDVVLTSDDEVANAKRTATKINKQRQEVNRRIKDEIAKASEPIRDLDEKRKELDRIHEEVRQRILAQVTQREQKVRDQAHKMLTDLRKKLWEELGVEHGYRRAGFDDLVQTSSVTAKGNLTKAAKDKLEKRVRGDHDLQLLVERRLLELENRSYRAGLEAPLTREHISHFLWLDQAEYEQKLAELLEAEVRRQERAEARRAEKQKQMHETHQRVLGETTEQLEKEVNRAPPTPAQDPGDGKVSCRVTATFDIRVDPRLEDEKIEAELKKRMKSANINSLTSVQIRRQT